MISLSAMHNLAPPENVGEAPTVASVAIHGSCVLRNYAHRVSYERIPSADANQNTAVSMGKFACLSSSLLYRHFQFRFSTGLSTHLLIIKSRCSASKWNTPTHYSPSIYGGSIDISGTKGTQALVHHPHSYVWKSNTGPESATGTEQA